MTRIATTAHRRPKRTEQAARLLLAAALILPLLLLARPAPAPGNAQPALLALAKKRPEDTVRLIVQVDGPAADTAALIEALGGRVLVNLALINGLAAEMAAEAAVRLADSPAVRWISLDAPVVDSAEIRFHMLDTFEEKSLANNDGTAEWAGDWLEINDDGEAHKGRVRFARGALQMSQAGKGIQRSADLSSAASATLSFDYRPNRMRSGDDFYLVEISTDGGVTWSELARLSGNSRSWVTATYDIGEYMSADTVVRFIASETLARKGKLYLDNVQINYVEVTPEITPSALPGEPVVGNLYPHTVRATPAWDMGLTGQGITVAVIDSGIAQDPDFGERIVTRLTFNPADDTVEDMYGHGTHVAGILGGAGLYGGIAPGVQLISLKVSDSSGMAYESDVVAALQWIYHNHDLYNIRVVNISLNSTVEQSYHIAPLNAAVEILWFNGVVVVVSVGNKGPGGGHNTANASPANDPFVITVGATDEKGTADRSDDSKAAFSAHSTTFDGIDKPDIYAPGKDIISVLAANSPWAAVYPERVTPEGGYFKLSGTSMAAPMVTGAVALLLQDEPHLTPDQVKYRLIHSGTPLGDGEGDWSGEPYLDVYATVSGTSTESANTGIAASQLLWTGEDAVAWDSVSWNSVSWNSVSWNSVSWNSVSWNSVSWNSVSWTD